MGREGGGRLLDHLCCSILQRVAYIPCLYSYLLRPCDESTHTHRLSAPSCNCTVAIAQPDSDQQAAPSKFAISRRFANAASLVRHILPPPADGRMHGMSQKEEELQKSADVEIKSASSLPPAVRVRLPSRSHRAIAVRCRRRRRPACLAKPIGSGLSRRSLLL